MQTETASERRRKAERRAEADARPPESRGPLPLVVMPVSTTCCSCGEKAELYVNLMRWDPDNAQGVLVEMDWAHQCGVALEAWMPTWDDVLARNFSDLCLDLREDGSSLDEMEGIYRTSDVEEAKSVAAECGFSVESAVTDYDPTRSWIKVVRDARRVI